MYEKQLEREIRLSSTSPKSFSHRALDETYAECVDEEKQDVIHAIGIPYECKVYRNIDNPFEYLVTDKPLASMNLEEIVASTVIALPAIVSYDLTARR